MAIELSAVRLIAPWFGTSQAVWTSAIGAVLLALSVGYLWGGRWASSERPERPLAISLWAASAWAVCLPVIAPRVAEALLTSDASLEEMSSLLPLHSLACALALFFPPAMLLATAGPLVVELIVRTSDRSAGRAGGMVLAWSTIGSMVGTFGTTYVGIPLCGLNGTLWLTAGLIGLGAVLSARAGSHHIGAVLVLGAFLASSGQAATPDADLIASGNSPYQRVRIVQRDDGWRALEVNERRGSFQSLWAPSVGLLGPGYYYDYFALPPSWSHAEEEWSLLVLGLGAGTAWRVVEGVLPEGCDLHATGVELDPLVISLAQAHMGLPTGDPDRRILGGWDARVALGPLGRSGDRWDQLIIDVYANQVEIPAHLGTLEFFLEAKELLREGGWLQLNVGALEWDDPLVVALGATLAEAFGLPTLALEVPFSRNVVLVQRLGAPVVVPQAEGFMPEDPALVDLAQRARLRGTWGFIEAGDAAHLRDRRAPLEALQRLSSYSHLAWGRPVDRTTLSPQRSPQAQGTSDEVFALVHQEGAYDEALRVAEGTVGAEGDFLVTWTRHQAGDLTGALKRARTGLAEHPDDIRLLEQASWLATSLRFGAEGRLYAGQLGLQGHPSAERYHEDAVAVDRARPKLNDAAVVSRLLVVISLGMALFSFAYFHRVFHMEG